MDDAGNLGAKRMTNCSERQFNSRSGAKIDPNNRKLGVSAAQIKTYDLVVVAKRHAKGMSQVSRCAGNENDRLSAIPFTSSCSRSLRHFARPA
jgi:hypothetical protein